MLLMMHGAATDNPWAFSQGGAETIAAAALSRLIPEAGAVVAEWAGARVPSLNKPLWADTPSLNPQTPLGISPNGPPRAGVRIEKPSGDDAAPAPAGNPASNARPSTQSAIPDPPAQGPRHVYRGGSATKRNLTPRPGVDTKGLSANVALEGAASPGGKAQVIDTTKLKALCAECDNPATGHVTIKPKGEDPQAVSKAVEQWAATREGETVHPLTRELMDATVQEVKRPK